MNPTTSLITAAVAVAADLPLQDVALNGSPRWVNIRRRHTSQRALSAHFTLPPGAPTPHPDDVAAGLDRPAGTVELRSVGDCLCLYVFPQAA